MNRQKLIQVLERNQDSFSPVVPFDPVKDNLLLLDFTEKNKELTDKIVNDTRLFSDYINQKLQSEGARYGIGGYAEHRTVYRNIRLFGTDSSLRNATTLPLLRRGN